MRLRSEAKMAASCFSALAVLVGLAALCPRCTRADPPTDQARSLAETTVLLAFQGIQQGTVTLSGTPTHRSTQVVSGGTDCVSGTALLGPDVAALAGLAAPTVTNQDGTTTPQSQYVAYRTCFNPNTTVAPAQLPGSMVPVFSTDSEAASPGGGPSIEVWTADYSAVPWGCACAPTASACQMKVVAQDGSSSWQPAPTNLTLSPGMWQGAGCVRKACVELAGNVSSMPAVCR